MRAAAWRRPRSPRRRATSRHLHNQRRGHLRWPRHHGDRPCGRAHRHRSRPVRARVAPAPHRAAAARERVRGRRGRARLPRPLRSPSRPLDPRGRAARPGHRAARLRLAAAPQGGGRSRRGRRWRAAPRRRGHGSRGACRARRPAPSVGPLRGRARIRSRGRRDACLLRGRHRPLQRDGRSRGSARRSAAPGVGVGTTRGARTSRPRARSPGGVAAAPANRGPDSLGARSRRRGSPGEQTPGRRPARSRSTPAGLRPRSKCACSRRAVA